VLFASRPGASLTVAVWSLVVVVDDMDDSADEEEIIVISRLMLLVMDRSVNASIDRPMIHRIMVIINMVLLVLLRLLLLLLLVVVVVVVAAAAALMAFSKKVPDDRVAQRDAKSTLSMSNCGSDRERQGSEKKNMCCLL
jgi:hypothetical protein